MADFVSGWQAQMIPLFAQLIGQNVACEILFMDALHDDDKCASTRIVKPRLHCLIPPFKNTFAHFGAVAVHYVVRIIDADDVTTVTSQSAPD